MDYAVASGAGRVCVHSGVVYDGFNFGWRFADYSLGKKITDEITARGFVNAPLSYALETLGMALLGALFFVVGFIGYEQDEYHSMLLHSADPEHSTVQAVFEPVLPNHPVRLPTDFASHPEFEQEWWKLYALLEDEQGNPFSVQWNFLRLAQDERDTLGWQTPQLYFSSIVINGKKVSLRDQKWLVAGLVKPEWAISLFGCGSITGLGVHWAWGLYLVICTSVPITSP